MNHVHEFMLLHGSILPFTQQGLEKYNDVVTKSYFRGTSHQGEKALKQVMERQNRLEHLTDSGIKLKKRKEVTCSNCGVTGHNKQKCLEQSDS